MTASFTSVCVVGLGYVGLPTAVVFANRGLDVQGVDINPETVALINQGKVHFVEPDLDILVTAAVRSGKLKAALSPKPADAFILAVPTPFTEGRKPDLSFVEAASTSIAPVLKKGDLVVVESTVPVGTTEKVSAWLARARPELSFPHAAGAAADVHVAHSPERVLPGRVLIELVGNDRVIGGLSPCCAERAEALFRIAVQGQCLTTGARTAELVKLAENAFRDVNIAFANELALVCEKLGIDPWEAIALANHHPRVKILKPGPGVGGHCIAVDPWFIVDSAPDETHLIRAARAVNDSRPGHVARRIREAAAQVKGRDAVIACLGLSYKADIDDVRESPALAVVRALAEARAGRLWVVEPHLAQLPQSLQGLPGVGWADLDFALDHADVVALLVDHKAFSQVPRARLAGKTVVDTRGLWRGSESRS